MSLGLKDLDFLGVSPTLYVTSSKWKKTNFGGIASILTAIILMTSIVYFFSEVLLRNSFSLIYNQTTDLNPILDYNPYPFAIGFFDGMGNSLSDFENQIRLYGEYYEVVPDPGEKIPNNLRSKKIKFEKCDLQNFKNHFGNFSYLFKNMPRLKYYYCLPLNKLNFTLYGTYADALNAQSFFTVRVTKCFNSENTDLFPQVECLNRTIIDKNFSNVFLNLVYLDYELNHSNATSPGEIRSRSQSFPMSSSVYNKYFFKTKLIKYITDYGFLFSQLKTDYYFQEDTVSLSTDLRVNNSPIGLFGELNFSLSKKSDNYFRNYLKLQSALANIGGIVDGIFILCSLFVKFIMNDNYFNDIGKITYLFDKENESDHQQRSNFAKNFKRINTKPCQVNDKKMNFRLKNFDKLNFNKEIEYKQNVSCDKVNVADKNLDLSDFKDDNFNQIFPFQQRKLTNKVFSNLNLNIINDDSKVNSAGADVIKNNKNNKTNKTNLQSSLFGNR